MSTKSNKLMALIDRLFLELAVETDRDSMIGYMKGHFDFYGVKSPARKIVFKEIKKTIIQYSGEEIFTCVEELWRQNKRESQYLALDILDNKKNLFSVEYLPRVENLIITKSWWDTVDGLAPNIAGYLLKNDNDLRFEWIERWNNSNNMWLNRAALIHQLRYKTEVDLDLLFALVESRIGSKEFFINKASGWALRQASKFFPTEVFEFLEVQPNLSNLTKREASKYL